MGIAAYQRGSKVISEEINRNYLKNGGASKLLREQMERAELKIEELGAFWLLAQETFSDIQDKRTSTNLLESWLHEKYQKVKKTKRFLNLLQECADAHVEWVNSDERHTFIHLQTCRRKAQAWINVLTLLNEKNARFKYNIPHL